MGESGVSELYAYLIIKQRIEATEKFLEATLKTKAFPRIIGRPNRFSLWWRRIKLINQKLDDGWKISVTQRGKIIGEMILLDKINLQTN